MTFNEFLAIVSLIIHLLAFAFIPFSPLIMWYLADEFGVLESEENEHDGE